MKSFVISAVAALAVVNASAARAAEITLIAPGGIRAAVDQMIPQFEKKSGHTVKATIGSGGGTKDRVVKGDAFDVPIVQPPLDPVVKSGHVIADSQTLLASVFIGVAVKQGAPKPDISTPDAVKRLLLNAKMISYPNVEGSPTGGAAGLSINATLAKLGIADQMKPKTKPGTNGAGVMAMLAKGEIDIGLTFVSEIISEPGVEAVGALPRDISEPTELFGFLSAHAKDPAAAKALLAYLTGPDAAVVYKQRGMVPGH